MKPFPTKGRKLKFTDTEEVISKDLNDISTYLHQIIKDFNINVFQGQQIGSQPGCIISGCKVNLVSGTYPYVDVGPGLLMFSVPASDSTDMLNFSGSLYPLEDTVVPFGTISLAPSGGTVTYAIDVRYVEVLDQNLSTRNVYSPVTKTSGPTLVSATTLNDSTSDYSVIFSVASQPIAGYARLGTFTVDDSGNLSDFNYTLPFIWNIQNWPGVPNTFDLTLTKTLADSLSAIRAQLAAIVGPTSKWYTVPPTDIDTAATDIATLSASVAGVVPGIKSADIFAAPSNVTLTGSYPVLPGVKRLWVRLWGPGGHGGITNIISGGWVIAGGGGGAGGYVEHIFEVTPGDVIPYQVGGLNTVAATTLDLSSIPGEGGILSAGGGANAYAGGQTGHDGEGGAGGVASGGSFNVNGTSGGNGSFLYNAGGYGYEVFGRYSRYGIAIPQGGFSFAPVGAWGHGGYAGSVNGGVGTNGMPGALIIYCM